MLASAGVALRVSLAANSWLDQSSFEFVNPISGGLPNNLREQQNWWVHFHLINILYYSTCIVPCEMSISCKYLIL
jgi:hypothetical protein